VEEEDATLAGDSSGGGRFYEAKPREAIVGLGWRAEHAFRGLT
jgi:hypothetical protein